MSENIDDKFYEPLADDHLVMINKDTFTVERLKELVNKNLREKLSQSIGNGNFSLASWLGHPLKIIDGEVLIDVQEMMWIFQKQELNVSF